MGRELRRAAGGCWLLHEASQVWAPGGSGFESWQLCDLLVYALTCQIPHFSGTQQAQAVGMSSSRGGGVQPSTSPTEWACSQEGPRSWCREMPPLSPGKLSSAPLPFVSSTCQWLMDGKLSSSFPTQHHHHDTNRASSCLQEAGKQFLMRRYSGPSLN